MSLQKINNAKIKPVKIKPVEVDKIKGSCLFPELYPNILIVSKKKTGKSSLIWNIILNCAGKLTKIIIFSPSVDRDPTYKHILKYCKKKGIDVITFHSIKENGVDNLRDVMNTIQQEDLDEEDESSDEEEIKKTKPVCMFNDDTGDIPKKPRKEKHIAPHYIFILDDLSRELRSPTVAHLLKTNRWYKAMVICSTQYPNDLLPESIKNFSFLLLGQHHTLDKLEEVHQKTDLSLPYDKFVEYYTKATADKYNFLYVNTVDEEYRKGFSERFIG